MAKNRIPSEWLLGKEEVVVAKVGPSGHPKDDAMLEWCRPPIDIRTEDTY
jgi:hypothetical protein